jgi:hypothetical protein
MTVDVRTEIDIGRPRAEVAGFAADPLNAPKWYVNIKNADWVNTIELAVGNRIAFTAYFLGRKLAYSYVIREYIPGARLVMATTDGPFAMQTTYEWTDTADGGTLMTLRNTGTPSGLARIAAPAIKRAIRRANRKDLLRLKDILETDAVDGLHRH